jgi:hypothetical protein
LLGRGFFLFMEEKQKLTSFGASVQLGAEGL